MHSVFIDNITLMKQHDINFEEDSEKKIRVPDGIWDSDFFFESSSKLISCCCFIFNILTLEVGWLHLGYALM